MLTVYTVCQTCYFYFHNNVTSILILCNLSPSFIIYSIQVDAINQRVPDTTQTAELAKTSTGNVRVPSGGNYTKHRQPLVCRPYSDSAFNTGVQRQLAEELSPQLNDIRRSVWRSPSLNCHQSTVVVGNSSFKVRKKERMFSRFYACVYLCDSISFCIFHVCNILTLHFPFYMINQ